MPIVRQGGDRTHVYRDSRVFRGGRFLWLQSVGVCALALAILFGRFPVSWSDGLMFGTLWAFVVLHQYAMYRSLQYGTCGEIRLSDDGTCELETRAAVIRLHVNEIRSVRHSPESDDSRESYTIVYRGGKLEVGKAMTDFADFVTRLLSLNPSVDLTSFPADAWPGIGAAGKAGGRPAIFRSVLIPLTVVVLTIYLANDVLLGQ